MATAVQLGEIDIMELARSLFYGEPKEAMSMRTEFGDTPRQQFDGLFILFMFGIKHHFGEGDEKKVYPEKIQYSSWQWFQTYFHSIGWNVLMDITHTLTGAPVLPPSVRPSPDGSALSDMIFTLDSDHGNRYTIWFERAPNNS